MTEVVDSTDGADDDPYLWLEEVEGERALAWVEKRNAESAASLATAPRFGELRDAIREVLDSSDRIPFPIWRGEHLYNFWRDEEHPRGLWRRTTLDEYRTAEPRWQVLLDVDALAADEDENWVWQSATALRPGNARYLVSLSRGGSDASVVREFDAETGAFVPDGFALAEAKSDVAWIDVDHIYVSTDVGPGSLTTSGYPRIVKQWRRGTALEEASTVFEAGVDDMIAVGEHDQTPGYPRDFVHRRIAFFRGESFLRRGGELVRVDVPEDALVDVAREWLLVRLRSPWTVGATTYPAGALLAANFDDFLAGARELTVLFEPQPGVALSYHMWTRHHLILGLLRDVRSEVLLLTPSADGWRREPLPGVPEFSDTYVADTNPDLTDDYLISSMGFTEPTTLRYGTVGGPVEVLKREPAYFDADGLTVRQLFATSPDGTRVPYFVVGPQDHAGPTLLTGYGGFEIPLTPCYDAITGRGWLARGGTYVVANIRGGGEYGPAWHDAALREKRPRAYEDLAAVAGDLVARGITTAARLGFKGGSNGGLLAGVMLTRYPELFGAIVSHVPLMDMRRYHRLLAGASWVAEYGNPDDPADWAFLRGYSPYHNVRAGLAYPPVLVITSTRDDRVHPGHARKMVALLREHGYDVTYYENVEGGHGAAADNAQLAYRSALMFEFLWRTLAPGQL